jgi:hypothetical protein
MLSVVHYRLNRNPHQIIQCHTEDNDPQGEHDFDSIKYNGKTIFWKFNHYDRNLEFGSPDPTDPEVTYRIPNIKLAEEY